MIKIQKYIEVILPLPVEGTFTYYICEDDIFLGQRVVVQFGARKLYTGIVKSIHENKPIDYKAKPILAILDEQPILNPIQLKLWEWISDYYMCSLGSVMNAALPSQFKLASTSKIIIHPNFDGDINDLSFEEKLLLDALLQKDELTINNVIKLLNIKNIFSFINELIRREVVLIKEDLHDKYKLKIIRVAKFIISNKELKKIKLTKKQSSFLDAYSKLETKEWVVSDLLSKIGFSNTILKALIEKGVFKIKNQSVTRLKMSSQKLIQPKTLVDFQKKALNEINKCFKEKNVCLLHGVTSSGKTELYIRLINEQLEKGKQVLYLLPEIALTTQIIKRLQTHFGDNIGVTHSHLNNSERIEIWRAVQEKNLKKIHYPIILGARSSLFLPFDNLGLIIIDEEHDSSFKQQKPSPRYHARDTAIYLASLHNAKVLLGSATPSLETYYNVNKNKYGLVEMNSRFKGIELPKIQTIDIRKANLKRQMNDYFSHDLLNAISETLKLGKQVILFQNRRGYSPVLSCESCAYTPKCNNCDVSLTYYKLNNHLKCHYCGYIEQLPDACHHCSCKVLIDRGFGTEKIEASLHSLFPDHITKRMDYDTTRAKNAYQKIITEFENGIIDILVGTQMITKGLDFDNVAMVGILNADSMLTFPDFRSHERAFQLMTQVSGRAGRKGSQGQVFIQTFNDNHPLFKILKSHTFKEFLFIQAKDRKLFNYPPYSRLIKISFKHKSKGKIDEAGLQLAKIMRKSFGDRVLGPEYPIISRIKNFYHKNLLLKIEQGASIIQAKLIVKEIVKLMQNHTNFKSVRFSIDVDPI